MARHLSESNHNSDESITEPDTELDQDMTGGVVNVNIPGPEDVSFYTIENQLGLPEN
jgi:hypothetical protein